MNDSAGEPGFKGAAKDSDHERTKAHEDTKHEAHEESGRREAVEH